MKIWKLNKQNGVFPALGGTSALLDASPEELRVLLCLCEMGEAEPAALSRAAGCSRPRVGAALRYWQEVGAVVESEAGELAREEKKPLMRTETPETPAAEVARSLTREEAAQFIDTFTILCRDVYHIFTLCTIVISILNHRAR